MARRNVDLVIRARDEAKTTLSAVNQALEKFTKNTSDVRDEAARTDTRLDSLGTAFRELRQAVGQLGAAGRVEQQLRRVTNEINRQEAAIAKTEASLRDYSSRFDQTRSQTDKLAGAQTRLAKQLDTARAAADRSREAQRELASTASKAQRAQDAFANRQRRLADQISTQNQKLAQYETRLQSLQAKLASTENPTAALTRNFERTERAIASARERIADLAETQNLIQASSDRAANAVQRANDIYGRQARNLDQNVAALDRAKQAYQEAAEAAKASAREQSRLEVESKKSAASLEQQNTSLQRARRAYEATEATLRETTGALNQFDNVTRRSFLRTLREQITRVSDARQAYRELSGEASRLGAALRRTEQPTNAQVQAFDRFRAAAALARQEFRAQGQALSTLRSILRESGGDVEQLSQRITRFQQVLQGARSSYAGLQQASSAAANAASKLAHEQNRATRNTGRLRAGTDALADSTQRAAKSKGIFAEAMRKFYGESRTALSFTQRLRGEVLSLIAAYGGFFAAIEGIRGVVNAYRTLEQAQNRLGAVFKGDQNAQARELDFVRRTADRLGISYGALAQEYTKFAVATQGTNLEGEKTRRIFRQVAEAGRVQGLTLDQLQGTFVALTQIVSKGKVTMEELQQQLGDRLPGALQILADGLGQSTEELIELIHKGELSSEALVNFGDGLERRFGGQLTQALEGVNTAVGRFQNSIFQAFLTIGRNGAVEGFANLLNEIATALDTAAAQDFLVKVGEGLRVLFDLLGAVARNWDLVIVSATTFISLRVAPFAVDASKAFSRWRRESTATAASLAATTTSVRAFTASLFTATGAVSALRKALTFLLSATGIGLLVTLIGTGIGVWATRGSEATDVMLEHRKTVDAVKDAYDAVGRSITEIRDRLTGLTQIGVEKQIKTAEARFGVVLEDFEKRLNGLRAKSLLASQGPQFEGYEDREAIEEYYLEVKRLFDAFRDGDIEVDEFRKKLAEVSVQMRDNARVNKRYSEAFDDLAESLVEPFNSLKEIRKVLTVMTADTDEAVGALDDLTGMTPDAVDPLAEAARRTKEFEAAVRALAEQIPEFKAEFDLHAQLETLDDLREKAQGLAQDMTENARVTELYNRALRDLEDRNLDRILAGTSSTSVGDGSLTDRIIAAESAGVPDARNPNSSATGVGQFIESTWLDLFRRHLPDRAESMARDQILALRTDPQLSRQFVDIYLRELAKQLKAGEIPVTETNLSLAYFLGPGGAKNIVEADEGTLANDVLPPSVIEANSSVLDGQTREQVLKFAAERVALTKEQAALDQRIQQVRRQAAEDEARLLAEQEKRKEATLARIAQAETAVRDQELLNAGREREVAILQAQRAARQENVNITDEQLEKLAELAGQQFDLVNAERLANAERERAREIESDINELIQLRVALTALLEEQFAQGESEAVLTETRAALEGVNEQLQEAIQGALQLLSTFDQTDPAVAAITARLQELAITGQESGYTIKLTYDDISNAFQGAFKNAVQNYAKALAEGENAVKALGDTFRQFAADFLRMIAQMITQQLALNAAKAILGVPVGSAHTGGIVGARTASRRVDPAIFAGAMRYHRGGIAGLRPGEVPTILQRGEEVLTQNDPRHIFNGGGASGEPSPITPRIVNAIDGASFLEEGMRSKRGQEAILNYIQANRSSVRGALGA